MAILMALIVIFVIVLVAAVMLLAAMLVAILYIVTRYIVDGIVKMRIFSLFGTCNPLLAWVPFVSDYMLGETCIGRDGQSDGIFGLSMPNMFLRLGWLLNFAYFVIKYPSSGAVWKEEFVVYTVTAFLFFLTFIYNSSVCCFILSRLRARNEDEVRLTSILCALFFPAFIYCVFISGSNVHSLENDVYPLESPGKFGGLWD